MKKWFYILVLLLGTAFAVPAQNDGNDGQPPHESKIRERMQQYIQDRLSLTKNEAERFTPVFVRYFREFAQTHHTYKGDRLVLQQKIIDLRIRYRNVFRQVFDEQRANKIYQYEDEFRRKAMEIIRENRRNRIESRPQKRNNSVIL